MLANGQVGNGSYDRGPEEAVLNTSAALHLLLDPLLYSSFAVAFGSAWKRLERWWLRALFRACLRVLLRAWWQRQQRRAYVEKGELGGIGGRAVEVVETLFRGVQGPGVNSYAVLVMGAGDGGVAANERQSFGLWTGDNRRFLCQGESS